MQIQCFCEKIWHAVVHCRMPDSQDAQFPFTCPLDYVFNPGTFESEGNVPGEHGTKLPVREFSFLDNPRTPKSVKVRLRRTSRTHSALHAPSLCTRGSQSHNHGALEWVLRGLQLRPLCLCSVADVRGASVTHWLDTCTGVYTDAQDCSHVQESVLTLKPSRTLGCTDCVKASGSNTPFASNAVVRFPPNLDDQALKHLLVKYQSHKVGAGVDFCAQHGKASTAELDPARPLAHGS